MSEETTLPDDSDDIRALVARLARPHRSGGTVIERAAILAAGADFDAVIAWITAHDGEPEEMASLAPRRGLHGSRLDASGTGTSAGRPPLRFILPPGALA